MLARVQAGRPGPPTALALIFVEMPSMLQMQAREKRLPVARAPLSMPPGPPTMRRIGRRRALLVMSALLFASAVCLGMALARNHLVGHRNTYLIWNLLLAWIPLLCSIATYRSYLTRGRPRVLLAGCVVAWFFFFPNAPYMITDFVHLQPEADFPYWLDMMCIASFAWTGLSLGYLSLYLMHEIVRSRLGRWGQLGGWAFVVGMLGLSSAGIYIGRFMRWNSWDLLRHPARLLYLGRRLSNSSLDRPDVVAFVLVLFFFLLLSYCATFALTHLHEETD